MVTTSLYPGVAGAPFLLVLAEVGSWASPLRYKYSMQKVMAAVASLLLLTAPMLGQGKRLWVLRPGEMVEYDSATFVLKQTVKVPPSAVESSQSLAVNHVGQILFVPAVSLPLADAELVSPHKVWFWNGQHATSLDEGIKRETSTTGSNQALTEVAPTVVLAADGKHLFWFANEVRRLQREDVDLSATTTWHAWQTDLSGGGREDLVSTKLPDCRCSTGACEETCPSGVVWVPEEGVASVFILAQIVAGKEGPVYKSSMRYQEQGGKWAASPLPDSLRKVLDASADGDVIVEAIPDTGCCGWSNQSSDQTLVLAKGRTHTVFDEWATYKNPDYDVSFYTPEARISPDRASVAMNIAATAKPNQSIQLAEQGQANPEENKQIRKALADLPAVQVKSLEDAPRQIAFLPHATMVGWVSDKELLIVEDHLLVAYNVATRARRKSNVRVDDATRVFLR